MKKKENQGNGLNEIPFIDFPDNFLVKIIPNFAGSVVRFRIKDKNKEDSPEMSIYLDCYENMGMYYGENDKPSPYWEVYPHFGDVFRCGINEIESLIEGIQQGLDNPDERETNETD